MAPVQTRHGGIPIATTLGVQEAPLRVVGTDFKVSAENDRTDAKPGLSGIALALVLVASFMVVLDFSIVNVALPTIRRALGFGGDSVQWVVTAYAITFGGLLILGGRIADVFGRRRMFIIGLLVFAGASLMAGFAADPGLLLAARAVQGVGGALVAPTSLSLITARIAEGPRRTRALGLYGATASIGFVAGQVLGGVLVQYASWRSIFLVNVPVGVVLALAIPRLITRDGAIPARRRIDVLGGVLVTGAVAALVFSVSEATVLGWSDPTVIGAMAVAVVALIGFVALEKVHPYPLVNLSLVLRTGLRTAGALSFFVGMWTAGELVVLSLYLQQTLHDSPLATGMVIAPQGIVGFVTGMFGSRLVRRLGMRTLLIASTAFTGVGFSILAGLPAHGRYSPVFLGVVLVGFGTVGTIFGSTVMAASGMADSDQGLVGGVVNTTRQVGAAVGVAVLVAIAEGSHAREGVSTVSGDRTAILVAAFIGFAGVLVAWLGPRSSGEVEVPIPASHTTVASETTNEHTPMRRTA